MAIGIKCHGSPAPGRIGGHRIKGESGGLEALGDPIAGIDSESNACRATRREPHRSGIEFKSPMPVGSRVMLRTGSMTVLLELKAEEAIKRCRRVDVRAADDGQVRASGHVLKFWASGRSAEAALMEGE